MRAASGESKTEAAGCLPGLPAGDWMAVGQQQPNGSGNKDADSSQRLESETLHHGSGTGTTQRCCQTFIVVSRIASMLTGPRRINVTIPLHLIAAPIQHLSSAI